MSELGTMRIVEPIPGGYRIVNNMDLDEPSIDVWVTGDFKVAISKGRGPAMAFSAGQAHIMAILFEKVSKEAYELCASYTGDTAT